MVFSDTLVRFVGLNRWVGAKEISWLDLLCIDSLGRRIANHTGFLDCDGGFTHTQGGGTTGSEDLVVW